MFSVDIFCNDGTHVRSLVSFCEVSEEIAMQKAREYAAYYHGQCGYTETEWHSTMTEACPKCNGCGRIVVGKRQGIFTKYKPCEKCKETGVKRPVEIVWRPQSEEEMAKLRVIRDTGNFHTAYDTMTR